MKKYGENSEKSIQIGSYNSELWPKVQNYVDKWLLMLPCL